MDVDIEQRKQELLTEIKDWSGKNRIIVKRAREELMRLGHFKKDKSKAVKKEDSTKGYHFYKKKTVTELKKLAKKLDVPKYYSLKEDDLIKAIMKK